MVSGRNLGRVISTYSCAGLVVWLDHGQDLDSGQRLHGPWRKYDGSYPNIQPYWINAFARPGVGPGQHLHSLWKEFVGSYLNIQPCRSSALESPGVVPAQRLQGLWQEFGGSYLNI